MTDVTGRAERPLDLEPAARRIALNELVLHGWHLARATGQPYEPDTESLAASYAMLAPSAHDRPPGGPFGPAVEVPADAPLLDRVIGLSGRDPSWWPSRRSTA